MESILPLVVLGCGARKRKGIRIDPPTLNSEYPLARPALMPAHAYSGLCKRIFSKKD